MTETVKLGKFEGRTVAAAKMTLTGTGDGLSQAMQIDPVVLHHGDEVYLVVKGVVADVRFPPVSGTESVARQHLVEATLEGQRRRHREMIEAETGQGPLPGTEDA